MADFTISVNLDAKGVKTGASQVKSEMNSLARTDFSGIKTQIDGLGRAFGSIVTTLTRAVTLPLAALAGLGIRAALQMDTVRTKLTALLGSAEAANARITALQKLSAQSVGVLLKGALEADTQMRAAGVRSEQVIDQMIKSLGKLNAAFKIEDQGGFLLNLSQIFNQGFEIADIKEAIGRVPIFRELLKQAFGTDDPGKLKELKESGKLTLETFMSGLSGAINNDPRIANISENLSTKMAKAFERLDVALAPLGAVLLNVLVPAIEALVPYIQSVSDWFQKLSPVGQSVVVVIGAIAAAIGPALVVIASLVAALGTLVTSSGAIAIAILAMINIFLTVGPVLVIVAGEIYALYQAWQTNFGGIRDFTLQTWENIKAIFNAALSAIQAFWQEHGTRIMAFVNSYWNAIKNLFGQALNQLQTVVRFALQLLNGDWEGAWNSLLKIIQNQARFWATVVRSGLDLMVKAFFAIIPILIQWAIHLDATLRNAFIKIVGTIVVVLATLPQRLVSLIPKFIAAGKSIASAFIEGIKSGFSNLSPGPRWRHRFS
jgi:hypothetical protein